MSPAITSLLCFHFHVVNKYLLCLAVISFFYRSVAVLGKLYCAFMGQLREDAFLDKTEVFANRFISTFHAGLSSHDQHLIVKKFTKELIFLMLGMLYTGVLMILSCNTGRRLVEQVEMATNQWHIIMPQKHPF